MTTTADRPSTRRINRSVRALGLSVLLLATACGEQEDGGYRTTTPTATAPAGTLSPIDPNSTTSQPGRGPESQESTVNITISYGKDELAGVLNGVLNDTAVARDFAALLPLTLEVSDFHSTEKIADLPRKLDTTTAPAGTAAVPGDITYYAPWGNLALFYRDGAYADGLVRLGQLTDGAAAALAQLPGRTAVTVALPPN